MQPEERENRPGNPLPQSPRLVGQPIGRGQLLPRGVIALITSVTANLLILIAARSLIEVDPEFQPFSASRVAVFTVLGVATGLAVAVTMNRFAKNPLGPFRWTILTLLVLSFLPDVGLLAGNSPGATVPAVASLMLMHVAAGSIFIALVIGRSKTSRAT